MKAINTELQKNKHDAIGVLSAVLEFGDLDIEIWRWPYPQKPLDMSPEDVLQIDLLSLRVLQSMLDREGGQSPGVAITILFALGQHFLFR